MKGTVEKKKVKILFLEDSQDDYELNLLYLKKSDLQVDATRVETKKELLKQLDGDWDILLSDYNLPDINGIEAYEIVKEHNPDLPMVMVTGALTEDAAIACIETGVSNYVLKGNLTRLGSAVKQALEKRYLEDVRKKYEKQLTKANEELIQKADDIKELLRQKDEFIGQLGHDLKTPLSVLINILPMIQEDSIDPEVKSDCDISIRNVEYIKSLVTETLQIAELSSPNSKLDFKELNLMELADNVVKDNQLLLEKQNIKIENIIDEEIVVTADELRLGEVFNNLISNAVKYSGNNGGSINIEANNGKDCVTISVSDIGIGMTKEQMEHIFDEFYKADDSRHNLDSSGLGLNICKRIVEKHGGKIWVESPGEGKGSTFYFTLKVGKKEGK